jgi:ankyrin repeat protein
LGATPLGEAADRCHPEIAALLIAAGADVDSSDEDGFTHLMTAAEAGCESVAQLLLEAGVDPSLTSEGKSAADLARAWGHIALTNLLSNYGTELPHWIDGPGQSVSLRSTIDRGDV